MLKVEGYKEWAANTVNIEGDDNIYLKLSGDGISVWYVADSSAVFVPVDIPEQEELNVAWINRWMRHGKA